MKDSLDLIHTQGRININHENLKKAFTAFDFDISKYKQDFLRSFLRADLSILSDAKDIQGGTVATININKGTLELGRDNKHSNKKIKNTVKDFIQGLKDLDLIEMQTKLESYLKEHFNYKEISFKVFAQNNEMVIEASSKSELLFLKELFQHKEETLLFSQQKNIINYFFELQELDKEIQSYKSLQGNVLKEIRIDYESKIQKLRREYENNLDAIRLENDKIAEEKESEILETVKSIETKFKLKHKHMRGQHV